MHGTIDDRLTRLVHAEFREMPGLRLTAQQARRLWGLDGETCDALLTTLLETGFLTVMPDGRFARTGDSEATPPRRPMLKAAQHKRAS